MAQQEAGQCHTEEMEWAEYDRRYHMNTQQKQVHRAEAHIQDAVDVIHGLLAEDQKQGPTPLSLLLRPEMDRLLRVRDQLNAIAWAMEKK